ncbi:MAG: hypothetical protein HY999_02795 [Nitrospinae bacterium]|nr:hypothetical protein [Nitrospinota bacterium]
MDKLVCPCLLGERVFSEETLMPTTVGTKRDENLITPTSPLSPWERGQG